MPKTEPISLEVIKIKSPCPADWEAMRGNDRKRFCGKCNLHVYNLSAMSRDDAENLIAANEGRLCVRLYQREDGTVLTDDCSRIRRAMRRTRLIFSGAAGALMMLMFAPFGFGSSSTKRLPPPGSEQRVMMGDLAPVPVIMGKIAPPALQGEVSLPTTAPSTQPTTAPATQP